MDRRRFLRASLQAAAALTLASCTKSPSSPTASKTGATPGSLGPAPRPTLRLGDEEDYGFPSPFAYRLGPGYQRMSYLYDSLLWSDSTGKLLPWLAGRYQRSSDGMTYSFELRDNARWHDGRPVTPDDVVFTLSTSQLRGCFPSSSPAPRTWRE